MFERSEVSAKQPTMIITHSPLDINTFFIILYKIIRHRENGAFNASLFLYVFSESIRARGVKLLVCPHKRYKIFRVR